MKSRFGRARRFSVAMAAASVLAFAFAGEASAAGKAKVLNVNARAKMFQGNEYVAKGQIRNRSARAMRGKVRVFLAKRRGRPGGHVAGRSNLRIRKRSGPAT